MRLCELFYRKNIDRSVSLNSVFTMKWIYMGVNGVKRNKYKFLISNKDGENVQKLYDIWGKDILYWM